MSKCEEDKGKNIIIDGPGDNSLLKLADLDQLEEDIFQETLPDKENTIGDNNIAKAPLPPSTRKNDRLSRPIIMDISYIDRLDEVYNCIGEVNLEAELGNTETNTPPLKRSADFHIPSPEVPLRKINKLTEAEEESKTTSSDDKDANKENTPCNDTDRGNVDSSKSIHIIPVIKTNIQSSQSKLRQPTKRKFTDPPINTAEHQSQIK